MTLDLRVPTTVSYLRREKVMPLVGPAGVLTGHLCGYRRRGVACLHSPHVTRMRPVRIDCPSDLLTPPRPSTTVSVANGCSCCALRIFPLPSSLTLTPASRTFDRTKHAGSC